MIYRGAANDASTRGGISIWNPKRASAARSGIARAWIFARLKGGAHYCGRSACSRVYIIKAIRVTAELDERFLIGMARARKMRRDGVEIRRGEGSRAEK